MVGGGRVDRTKSTNLGGSQTSRDETAAEDVRACLLTKHAKRGAEGVAWPCAFLGAHHCLPISTGARSRAEQTEYVTNI